jgi:hypothetical protein
MTPEAKRWALGGGALLALLLLMSRRESDQDVIARILLTETDLAHPRDEMAQIVFVALNRMRTHKSSAIDVVTSSTWCYTSKCRARFNSMGPSHPRWEQARAFVKQVMDGQYKNLGYTAFIHPSGMPTQTPCVRSDLVPASTIAGTRCIPTWAVGGTVIGQGMFARA